MGPVAETDVFVAGLVSSYTFLEVPCGIFDFKLHEGKCDRTDLMPLKSLLHSVQVIIKTALYFGN